MTNNIQKRYTRYKEYKKEKSQEKYINYFIYALMGCIALCGALIFLSYLCAKLFDLGANDLGDSFGSVNAVISALAFLGVFIALIMQQKQIDLQRKDLALQRRELKNNTKELSLQRKEFEEQNRNIRLQRFENTFFQMLSLHHEIVAGLRLITFDSKYIPTENMGSYKENIKYEIIGRKTFFEIYNTNLAFDTSGKRNRSIWQLISIHGIEGYGKYVEISILDHYFRNLYRIIKFVDSTPERKNKEDNEGVLTIAEKKEYIAILRASLSEYELVMLFFNCLYMRDIIKEPQFKEFAERYHLFNNIRPEKVRINLFEKFEGEYEASAFNW